MKKVNVATFNAKLMKFETVASQVINTSGKVHADGIVRTFKKLLKSGTFRPSLKPSTIKAKRRAGMSQPSTSLYGWGESVRNSMINGLQVQTQGRGKWTVKPFGKHHSNISMQKLFAIHQYGATLKNGGKIPARKPLSRSIDAYRKSSEYLRENFTVVKKIAAGLVK